MVRFLPCTLGSLLQLLVFLWSDHTGRVCVLITGCHCWDYTPQACGSTTPALLIQSLIKISCKSLRQMQSQAAIGPINTQSERSFSAAGESARDGVKHDLGRADEERTSQSLALIDKKKGLTVPVS